METFSLSSAKRLIVPLVTLAIIGVMWSYYVLVFVPDRIEYLSGRNFRILASIGNDITSGIDGYNDVGRRTGFADGQTQGTGGEHEEACKARKQEIRNYNLEYRIDRKGPGPKWVITYVPEPASNSSCRPVSSFPVQFAHREFDIVLIADDRGQVLFHHAPSGVQILGLDQLGPVSVSSQKKGAKAEKSEEAEANKKTDEAREEKDKKTESEQAVTPEVNEVREVTVAGHTYKAFLWPVEVPVNLNIPVKGQNEASGSMKGTHRWVIAGLVKTDRFLSECKAISYTVRSVVISLLIVMAVGIPLMRMLTLGNRERLRPLNIVMLAYSLLMGTALVTLFLAAMFVYLSDEARLNDQADNLAGEIAAHVRTEIQLASRQLVLMTTQAVGEWQKAFHWHLVERKQIDILTRENVITGPYPLLIMAFWVDDKGAQQVKWTTRHEATPLIPLSGRSYFQHARDNRLLTVPLETEGEHKVARIWVESIISWTTGEKSMVLAMPLSDIAPEFANWVAALETTPLTLINPVIPKGFKYAVIDESGQVLFHSDEKRNLRESFLEETGRDPNIRAALAGHMKKEVEGVYGGRDQHFVVTPLEWVPWTLVVLRDKQPLRAAGAEGLATATMLLLLYSLFLTVFVLAGWLLCRLNKSLCGHRASWLWPHPDKHRAYRRMLVFNLTMLIIMAALVLWGHGWKMLALGAGIPLIAAAFAVVQWTRRRTSTHQATYVKGDLYQFTAVSFVLVLSCLPSLMFFKVAYEVEHQLFLKEGQLSLAKGLVERELRVRSAYEEITLSSNHKETFLEQRLKTGWGKEAVFEQRLRAGWGKETLDVYGRFFADTKAWDVDGDRLSKAESSWSERQFLKLIETIRIPFDNAAIRSSGLIHDMSSDGTRSWRSTPDARLDLYYKPMEGTLSASRVIHLSSKIPALLDPKAVFYAAVAMAFVVWSVFAWTRRIGQTVLACQLMPASGYRDGQASPGNPIGNVLVLGPSVPNGPEMASYYRIDLDAAMVDDTWIDTVRADIAKARGAAIGLLNWDRCIESPLRNQQKLQLLHELLAEGRTVLIQSRIDPTQLDINGEADTSSEMTWLHALRSFTRIYSEESIGDRAEFEKAIGHHEEQALAALNGASHEGKRRMERNIREAGRVIRDECRSRPELQAIGSEVARHLDLVRVTSGEVLEAMSHAADHYYQRIWATCSRGEQYVLFALAQDGFVLSTQPAVRNLLQRGLIERTPMLAPFNTTFRQWVLEEGSDPGYAKVWTKGEPQRTVVKARHVMLGLLVAVGLFLYMTQQEEVNQLVQFGSALLAGIPIIAEWLGQLRGEKTATSAEK